MAETQLSDAAALELSGTTDADTGVQYPERSLNNWAAAFFRWVAQTIKAFATANHFRIHEVDGNPDAVGIRGGRTKCAGVLATYATTETLIDSLADNDTTYIYLYVDGSGTTQISSSLDAVGWPTSAHLRLAEVTMAAGAITAILDRRAEGWWNTDASRPNVFTHTANGSVIGRDSGSVHTNNGAAGTVTLSLPPAVAGLRFRFLLRAAQEFRLNPSGTETIALPSTGVQGGAGKYLVADAVGEWVELLCVVAGTWDAVGYAGTWAHEP